MQRMPSRFALALLVPLGLSACGDDSTGPNTLTAAEVQGNYTVCQAVFVPEGDLLPDVDILQRAFDPTAAAPVLALDGDHDAQLQFTRAGQFSREFLNGTLDPGINAVEIRLQSTSGLTPSELLFPARETFTFQEEPQALTVDGRTLYRVSRGTYTRLAGVSGSGLANEIEGRLTARAQLGGCG